jgi:hypothetical protein
MTISMVPGQVIQEQGTNDLVGALQNVPGVYAFTNYGIYEGYTFRGFLDLFPSLANQLLDGVRLPRQGDRWNSVSASAWPAGACSSIPPSSTSSARTSRSRGPAASSIRPAM